MPYCPYRVQDPDAMRNGYQVIYHRPDHCPDCHGTGYLGFLPRWLCHALEIFFDVPVAWQRRPCFACEGTKYPLSYYSRRPPPPMGSDGKQYRALPISPPPPPLR